MAKKGKKGSKKQVEEEEIEEEIEEDIPEEFSDAESSRRSDSESSSESLSKSSSESSAEEESEQESEEESKEESNSESEQESEQESEISHSVSESEESKSTTDASVTSYATASDTKSLYSPAVESSPEIKSTPLSPDGFSEASFDSYHSPPKPLALTLPKRVDSIRVPSNDDITTGRLNPDLHIRNATAYDRVIPINDEDDVTQSEKRELAIARLLGSSNEALNSQVGDRLQNDKEQENIGFKDDEYAVKNQQMAKDPNSRLSKIAKQPNALADYFAQQKKRPGNTKVYQEPKSTNEREKPPMMIVDHAREIGRQYYYDTKEPENKAVKQIPVPPRNNPQTREGKKLSNDETGVLDILLKACLTKVTNKQKPVKSQQPKKIEPDNDLEAYEDYIKERIEKELEESTNKFDSYLEPTSNKAYSLLPVSVLEQLLENVTSDVRNDNALQSVTATQIHKTLQSVLSEILVDPTITSVIKNAVKVKLKQNV